MALSFYPRLKCSTEVSERHVMLIFEKIPGGKFGKRFFERWGQNMELIICIIVGIIIGIVFGRRVFRSDVVGSLRVDQSDPDSGPYLFLELSHEGVDDVEEIVGEESLTHFGEYEDDSVFVRNDRLKCDYEILLDQRNYSDVTKTMPHRVEER